MKSTQWVDRYVAEVGRKLPAVKRADVEMEIRSLIQDELETLPAGDEKAAEAATLALLRKFGNPATMAQRYGSKRYLVGPALYPVFLLVLRIVLTVVVVLSLVGLGFELANGSSNFSIVEALVGLLGAALQAAATVVLVFAIVEYFSGERAAESEEAWDPRSLPELSDRNALDWSDVITELVTAIIGIVVFNLFVPRIDPALGDGPLYVVQIFSQNFLSFVPWLTLLWTLTLALAIVLVVRGRWEVTTRLLHAALGLFGIGILVQMLRVGSLAAWEPMEFVFTISLVIAAALTVWEVAQDLWAVTGGRTQRTPVVLPPTAGSL